MKTIVVCLLLIGLPFAVAAENPHNGLGFSASMDHQTISQTDYSDYQSTSDTFSIFGVFFLDSAWELDVSFGFVQQSIEDPTPMIREFSTDYSQDGLLGGVSFYASLATVGPLAIKSGVSGSLGFMNTPDNYIGTYSDVFGSVGVPLIVDISLGESWAIRVVQPVLIANAEFQTANGTKYNTTSFRLNSAFSPSVGTYFSF